MNFIILVLFIILVIVLTVGIKRSNKLNAKYKEEYFEKERKASFARKKPLTGLKLISFPSDIREIIVFEERVLNEYDTVLFYYDGAYYSKDSIAESIRKIKELFNSEIANLQGCSNTDLKLKYGVANINKLSKMDDNFSMLCNYSREISIYLIHLNEYEKAASLLEWLVECGGDTGFIFNFLSDYYIKENRPAKIHTLLKYANEINSIRKNSIVRMLTEKLEQS